MSFDLSFLLRICTEVKDSIKSLSSGPEGGDRRSGTRQMCTCILEVFRAIPIPLVSGFSLNENHNHHQNCVLMQHLFLIVDIILK